MIGLPYRNIFDESAPDEEGGPFPAGRLVWMLEFTMWNGYHFLPEIGTRFVRTESEFGPNCGIKSARLLLPNGNQING